MPHKILVIGEGRTFLESIEAIRGTEYQIVTADTVDAALETAHRIQPDLVLLDTRLSGIGAREACFRLKSEAGDEHPQVIAVSPDSHAPEEMRLLEAGADDYLGGRFSPETLISKVRLQLRLRAAVSSLKPAGGPIKPYASELEKLVAERTREMVTINGISVLTLTALAESREIDAEDRLLRMRYYSSILAAELAHRRPDMGKIDVKFLEDLYRSVPLHDIGKIAVSDAILLKRGRLTPVERKTVEEHTTIGAVILEQLASRTKDNDFLSMATVLARWHHERFDGTGYPSRLAGRDIPLPARIVALADVYDALTTPRPYREVETPEAAWTIIDEQSGKHLDPVVVDAFRRRFKDFVHVQTHFDKDSLTFTGAACFLD